MDTEAVRIVQHALLLRLLVCPLVAGAGEMRTDKARAEKQTMPKKAAMMRAIENNAMSVEWSRSGSSTNLECHETQ